MLQGVHAGLNLGAKNNLVVYWGQNSYGQSSGDLSQHRLSYYCDNGDINVFIISFVTQINGPGGVPAVNFANAGDNCTPFSGTSLLNCPQIAEDIKYCQSKGKAILLSIGGATYTEGGFSSAAAAESGAQLIWNTFGPANNNALRPFGNAVVDGFDLDFEATVNNMPAFANRLRALYQNGGKQYFLTAAPQCPYPDAANGAMLNGATYFDAIWVQFYNNYCGLQSYVAGSSSQPTFNLATWDEWARTTSRNENVKVLIGAPANTGAAGSGYVSAGVLGQAVRYGKQFSSFGGVMLWDASQSYANNGFLSAVRSALG
ncbi:glycoside hydrolase family 18 protein [Aspergillus candidus]|uniref:chitinase n=1 Tax=Aspergillus candidus TaxID=41067 RepID=A0A2I2FFV7_ASPCN|nr:putative class III chitinase [Aspergillus candidus]PLB39505.1 putative class III chitinase [Aspergillus candidus]